LPENWLNIFEQNKNLNFIKEKHCNNHLTNKHPIVLQHGNNPGLISHFVKAGIEYIVNTQYKKDKQLKTLIKHNKFNEAAHILGIKIIHVNDMDLQKIKNNYDENTLINTWCIDSFLFEMLTEATINIGSHENIDFKDECKFIDSMHGFLEFKKLSAEKKCRTYYPNGVFEGFLVPHDETVTIAKSLEVKRGGKVIYRPSVMFLYSPCHLATEYFRKAKVNEYPKPDPAKPLDCENVNGQTIIRGYVYPKLAEIVYQEKIVSGTEYVGVLLMGENFEPVWVGNRIELSFLYKNKQNSYWQTPTITPVAMSALAAAGWMIENKDKGGIYFPDDIADYKYILKIAEKYISKTIYKTFDKQTIKESLEIDFSNLKVKDFFVV
jgi:homospermidine synthase